MPTETRNQKCVFHVSELPKQGCMQHQNTQPAELCIGSHSLVYTDIRLVMGELQQTGSGADYRNTEKIHQETELFICEVKHYRMDRQGAHIMKVKVR